MTLGEFLNDVLNLEEFLKKETPKIDLCDYPFLDDIRVLFVNKANEPVETTPVTKRKLLNSSHNIFELNRIINAVCSNKGEVIIDFFLKDELILLYDEIMIEVLDLEPLKSH